MNAEKETATRQVPQQEQVRPAAEPVQREAHIAHASPQVAQLNAYTAIANGGAAIQRQAAPQGGLPSQLKSGIESLSGIGMDDVRVHYNSPKPAQLQAHAYAQGAEIHVAPGQERHLPHEAWHVVQQKQGRVKPTLQLKGIAINDDSALEREADAMGAKAMEMPAVNGAAPIVQTVGNAALQPRWNAAALEPRQQAGIALGGRVATKLSLAADWSTEQAFAADKPIQRYVTLGRVKTQWYHIGSGPTMKRLLTMDDFPAVLGQVLAYLGGITGKVKPAQGLTPQNVAVWKGIHKYGRKEYARIGETLRQWIGARVVPLATTTGLDEKAMWKEFDTVEELALALAHEVHPEYLQNLAYEDQLAGAVNESQWINAQLQTLLVKVNLYMATQVSDYRRIMDPVERRMFGSYNWASRVTSLFGGFKSGASQAASSSAISQTKSSITDSITFLHDLMERWSNAGAGSAAGKLHEVFGIKDVLKSAQDTAFESTMVDPETSNFSSPSGPQIGTIRSTKTVTQEEHEEVVFDIAIRRAIRAAEKSIEDIDDIARLQEKLSAKDLDGDTRIAVQEKIDRLKARVESRKARTAAEGFGQLSFNDNTTPQATVEARAETGKALPPPVLLAKMLKDKQKERANEKLKRVEAGEVDKSSKAKGRRNVGTRLEDNPDSLLARMFSAPITAGRSMTTARMMQLVDKVGGTPEEKTAVAFALFAYWARTYNKGLTPVHTFHETMDVARNFGVPYKPFHYPKANASGQIDFMDPKIFHAMSSLAPEFDLLNDLHERSSSVPLGLNRERWLEFMQMLDALPRVQRQPIQGVARQPEESDPMNIFAVVDSADASAPKPDPKKPDPKKPETPSDAPKTPVLASSAPKTPIEVSSQTATSTPATIAAIPSAKVEVSPSAKPKIEENGLQPFDPEDFPRIDNPGGGDCLFHAVVGRTLNAREMLRIRRAVADERINMPEAQNINAWNVMMDLQQTPGTRHIAHRLMEGRDNVPNNVFAALQAIPGMYAGDEELIQYCRLQQITVGVVGSDGELNIFAADGRHQIHYNPLNRDARLQYVLNTPTFALFKTPGHYERIVAGRQLVLRNQEPRIYLSDEVRRAFATMGLGLGNFEGVKGAYRFLAPRVHPDKHIDEVAKYTALFKQLNAAKELLENIDKDPKAKEKVMGLLKD